MYWPSGAVKTRNVQWKFVLIGWKGQQPSWGDQNGTDSQIKFRSAESTDSNQNCSENILHDIDVADEEMVTVKEIYWNPQRERNLPNISKTNSFPPVRNQDEPRALEALKGGDSIVWTVEMLQELNALKELQFWEAVFRPKGIKKLHSKFMLKRKRG